MFVYLEDDAGRRQEDQTSNLGHGGPGKISHDHAELLPQRQRGGARVRHDQGGVLQEHDTVARGREEVRGQVSPQDADRE